MPLLIKRDEDTSGRFPVLTRFAKFRNTVRFKEWQIGFWEDDQNIDQDGESMGKKKNEEENESHCFDNYAYDKSIISYGKMTKALRNDSKIYSSRPDLKISEKNHLKVSAPSTNLPTVRIDQSLAWKSEGPSTFVYGPDQILPSTAVRTSEPDGAIRIVDVGMAAGRRRPISVPSLLEQAARKAPNRVAMAVKREGEWKKWTYREYLHDVRTIAKAFIALGLERFHSVCILGFNSPEWFEADMAAIFAGGFAAGIYTTNSPEACAYCAMDSEANIFVVEDEKQLAKILEVRHQLPHLKAIVQYSGKVAAGPGILSWTDLLKLGNEQSEKLLDERLSQISINQCCTLIYTSGTTGNPKGVMLSHDSLTWTAYINCHWCNFRDCKEEYISYLPLSHVAAQVADIYGAVTTCATIYFGDKDALKGSLVQTMKEVQPTVFFAVPRVWEKMYEKMMEVGRTSKGVKKVVAQWAKSKGLDYNLRRMKGTRRPISLGFWLANKIVLSKVREALGLSRCSLNLSGAAPISQEILKYFMSLNIVVTEVYGMSECSGPHCMAIDSAFRLGSCGKTLPGMLTRIGDPDGEGNGEILMGGRHLGMGYLHQSEKTAAAYDPDGWLHSEDVGHVDQDGYLFITGRLKELLITAGGENVAPVPIEDRVKFELDIVSQALVLGDRLKFLSVLITLKTDVDKDTQEPLNTLIPYTRDWILEHGECHVSTVDDVLVELYTKNNQKLRQAITKGIERANSNAPSNAQKLQKWHLLPVDFSIPGGELGPTLKLKRSVVYNKYKDVIDSLYN